MPRSCRRRKWETSTHLELDGREADRPNRRKTISTWRERCSPIQILRSSMLPTISAFRLRRSIAIYPPHARQTALPPDFVRLPRVLHHIVSPIFSMACLVQKSCANVRFSVPCGSKQTGPSRPVGHRLRRTAMGRGRVKTPRNRYPIGCRSGRIVALRFSEVGCFHGTLRRRPEPVAELPSARER
jgi:hypothetical protein